MRSPLMPIASAVKLLERRGSDPKCVENVRALIGRQVTQLTRLVEDLLDFGRVEHSQLAVCKEPSDLRQVLAAAVETVQPIIAAQGHRLTTTTMAEAAIIQGDAGRLTQVHDLQREREAESQACAAAAREPHLRIGASTRAGNLIAWPQR